MDNNQLRPESLAAYVGQDAIKDRLIPIINEVKADREADPENWESYRLPHILLLGEAGLGKTTLASLIAWEMEEELMKIDLSQMTAQKLPVLLNNATSSVILMDEIHRGSPANQNLLLEWLEEGFIHTSNGYSRDVSEFTVIGATTEPRQLLLPLRSRFQVELEVLSGTPETISAIILGMADTLGLTIPELVVAGLAKASIGNPRVARDFVLAYRTLSRTGGQPDLDNVLKFVNREPDGLKAEHIRYMRALEEFGVLGETRLASYLRLHPAYVRQIESTLIDLGYVYPGPQGRYLLPKGADRLGKRRRRAA